MTRSCANADVSSSETEDAMFDYVVLVTWRSDWRGKWANLDNEARHVVDHNSGLYFDLMGFDPWNGLSHYDPWGGRVRVRWVLICKDGLDLRWRVTTRIIRSSQFLCSTQTHQFNWPGMYRLRICWRHAPGASGSYAPGNRSKILMPIFWTRGCMCQCL